MLQTRLAIDFEINPLHVSGQQFKNLVAEIEALLLRHKTATNGYLKATVDDEDLNYVEDVGRNDGLPDAAQAVIDNALGWDANMPDDGTPVENIAAFMEKIREVVSIPDPMGQAIFARLTGEYEVDHTAAMVYARDYINKVAFRRVLPSGHSYTEDSAFYDLAVKQLAARNVRITYANDMTSPQVEDAIDNLADDHFAIVIENEAVVVNYAAL